MTEDSLADSDSQKISRANRGRCSWSARAARNSRVLGFIESDKFTVCGGLIAACCQSGDSCVYRTCSENVIAIVNSTHCAWCENNTLPSAQESEFDRFGTRAYLRGVFRLKLSDAVRLSELIAELSRTRGSCEETRGFPFSATPPYCTVEDVTHVSSGALGMLLEFDREFVWGDNLIFNTQVRGS